MSTRAKLGLRAFLMLALFAFLAPVYAATAAAPGGSKEGAQKPYALLFGTVYDRADHPAYGVKIKIRRATEKKAKWDLVSDHAGEFAQRVPAGEADYVIWADVKTPKNQPKPEIKVHVINDERRDFSLHLTE